MSKCPLAQWKPLGDDPTHQPLMSKYDLVVIHTMVGTLDGTDAMFRAQGYVGVESHFGTGYVGGECVAYQWGDTSRTADANLYGNPRAISIENADTGPPYPAWKDSDVPPFTDDQCELVAQITAWACKTHGIPAVLAPDSRPTSRGIAWHRQGIDPYRVSDGEKWSDSYGKVCPGDKRVEQIESVIVPRVQEILAGDDKQNTQWPAWQGATKELLAARTALVNAQTVIHKLPHGELADDLKGQIDHAVSMLRSMWGKSHDRANQP